MVCDLPFHSVLSATSRPAEKSRLNSVVPEVLRESEPTYLRRMADPLQHTSRTHSSDEDGFMSPERALPELALEGGRPWER